MLNEMTPKIKVVQKMQDYIAAHQTEEINLSDLANTACYSPWYCYRIFKELTGMSVSDYVRREFGCNPGTYAIKWEGRQTQFWNYALSY